jgi:hypothetical protein
MTVRCEACGTENRDKAMFCRGCAGKLPAFVASRTTAHGRPDAEIHTGRGRAAPTSPAAIRSSSSAASGRFRLGLTDARIAWSALLMVAIGVSIAWFVLTSTDAERRTPAPASDPTVAGRLPPEASLSTGETLADGRASDSSATPPDLPSASPDGARPATTEGGSTPPLAEGVPGGAASSETTTPDTEPAPSARNTGRRSAAVNAGGGRAPDPRVGCEHLFFAFAARCEANHCQLPAYARHPRCELVREQRRRDDARRNSMPTS